MSYNFSQNRQIVSINQGFYKRLLKAPYLRTEENNFKVLQGDMT